MLARGGNAVDAALATAITLTVVEPCSNGIGCDLFAILWDGARARRAQRVGPRARGVDAGALRRTRRRCRERGWDAVTIPGAVSGWVALSQRFGKLPFADLFEPAIRYARDGYRGVAGRRREVGAAPCRCMPHDLGLRRALPAARPRAACPARLFALPRDGAHAREDRRDATAKRSIAASSRRRWSRTRSAHGGAHTLDDFAAHTVDWVTPLGARLPRRDGARDSAQRPGHRGADGARHPRALRSRGAAARFASRASTCRSRR